MSHACARPIVIIDYGSCSLFFVVFFVVGCLNHVAEEFFKTSNPLSCALAFYRSHYGGIIFNRLDPFHILNVFCVRLWQDRFAV